MTRIEIYLEGGDEMTNKEIYLYKLHDLRFYLCFYIMHYVPNFHVNFGQSNQNRLTKSNMDLTPILYHVNTRALRLGIQKLLSFNKKKIYYHKSHPQQ